MRLPLKAPGFGFEIGTETKFYEERFFTAGEQFEDTFAGQAVIIATDENGSVSMTIESTGEEIFLIRTF